MEVNKEKIPDNFENTVEKNEVKFSSPEKLKQAEKENPEKILERLKNVESSEENKEEKVKEISPEEQKASIYIKESRGSSISNIIKIIAKVRKKLSPFGIDKYHDEITKRKNDQ